MQTTATLLDEITKTCCISLFPEMDVRKNQLPVPDYEGEMAAVIGFSGKHLRGTLGVLGQIDFVKRIFPLPQDQDPQEEMLFDWLGEISNQLLGRIKGELMKYGQTLWIASPVLLRGVSLRVPNSTESKIQKYTFWGESGGLHVWVDYQYAEDLELARLTDPQDESQEAGEMLFF